MFRHDYRRTATPSLRCHQLRFENHNRRQYEETLDPADFLSPKGSLALAGAHAASSPSILVQGNRRLVEEEFNAKRLESSPIACAEAESRRNVQVLLALCDDFKASGQGQGMERFYGRVRGLDILYNRRPKGEVAEDDDVFSDVDEAELLTCKDGHPDVHPEEHHRCSMNTDRYKLFMRAHEILEQNSYFQHVEEQYPGTADKIAKTEGLRFTKVPAGTVFFRHGDPAVMCYIVVSGQVGVYKFDDSKHDKDSLVKKPSPRTIDLKFNPGKAAADKAAAAKGGGPRRPSISVVKNLIPEDKAKAYREREGLPEETDLPKRFKTLEGLNSYSAESTLGDLLRTLDAGEHFGELALLNDAPRAASIKCIEDCEVLAIQRHPFLHVMTQVKEKMKFFRDHFPELEKHCAYDTHGKHVTTLFHAFAYPQGHIFLREGIRSLETHLYIVLCGTVELCRYVKSSDNPTYLLASRPLEKKSWKAVTSRPLTGIAGSRKDEDPVGAAMAPGNGTQAVWDKLSQGDIFCSLSYIPLSGCEPYTVVAGEDCVLYRPGCRDQSHFSAEQRAVFQKLAVRAMAKRLRRLEKSWSRKNGMRSMVKAKHVERTMLPPCGAY